MRVPRVRFTVRRMMVAVAIVAVVMGATIEAKRFGRLSRQYQRKAIASAREERLWHRALRGGMASEVEAQQLSAVLRAKDQDLADLWAEAASESSGAVRGVREIVAHHARLRRKYEHAASRPWESVAPDPREPPLPFIWNCVTLPKEPLPPGKRWYTQEAAWLRARASSR